MVKGKETLKKGGKVVKEFKEFISRGNVIDMAVGVIIGSAFGKIVSSVVDDILMPLIGALIGGKNFTSLYFEVGGATVRYGAFIQNVVDFLIIALCVFLFVKTINSFRKRKEEPVVEEPKKDPQVLLLEEIRDLLKKQK